MADVIERVEAFPLVGTRSEGLWGPASGFVVRIATRDGIVGYGESDTMAAGAKAVIEAPYKSPLDSGLGELLRGTAAEPAEAWARMSNAVLQYGRDGVVLHAMAAIDIALWDIAGKRRGVPVASLLGGAKRDSFRCYATYPLAERMEEIAASAERLVGQGFSAIKMGWAPFGADAGTDETIVRTLRQAIGTGVDLLIDAGLAWDPATTLSRADLLRPFGLYWLEEPLRPYDIAGYAAVRRGAGIPIAAGEIAASADELIRLVENGCVDILQIDVSRTGLTVGQRVAEIAGAHGVAVVNHTYGYLINAAASLHLMAATPNISLYEYQANLNEIRHALNGDQLQQRAGFVALPRGPGLGIHIDDAILERFRGI